MTFLVVEWLGSLLTLGHLYLPHQLPRSGFIPYPVHWRQILLQRQTQETKRNGLCDEHPRA